LFLERERCLVWQQHAISLLDEIDDQSTSSSSSSSSSDSSDSDSEDEELILDAFFLASHNANTIACELTRTIEHPNIIWRRKGGLTIDELSLDDALTHFRFRKVHLQEVSDKLWPRLLCYLDGEKNKILFGEGHFSAPYETLLLLVLYRLARPTRLRRDMEGFFGYRRTKISAGIKAMVGAMYKLQCSTLTIPQFFTTLCRDMLK
jgi:hypothetical protein